MNNKPKFYTSLKVLVYSGSFLLILLFAWILAGGSSESQAESEPVRIFSFERDEEALLIKVDVNELLSSSLILNDDGEVDLEYASSDSLVGEDCSLDGWDQDLAQSLALAVDDSGDENETDVKMAEGKISQVAATNYCFKIGVSIDHDDEPQTKDFFRFYQLEDSETVSSLASLVVTPSETLIEDSDVPTSLTVALAEDSQIQIQDDSWQWSKIDASQQCSATGTTEVTWEDASSDKTRDLSEADADSVFCIRVELQTADDDGNTHLYVSHSLLSGDQAEDIDDNSATVAPVEEETSEGGGITVVVIVIILILSIGVVFLVLSRKS